MQWQVIDSFPYPYFNFFRETNLFYTQAADGIFGLGMNTNSKQSILEYWSDSLETGTPPNLVEISNYENRIESKGYALCYSHDGGMMTIGGHNKEKHLGNSTTQIIDFKNTGQFKVEMDSVSVSFKSSELFLMRFRSMEFHLKFQNMLWMLAKEHLLIQELHLFMVLKIEFRKFYYIKVFKYWLLN